MIKSKYIGVITIVVILLVIIFTCIFTYNGEGIGLVKFSSSPIYASKIFDDTKVHTIDIVMDDTSWNDLLESATDEEYYACTIVLDGEKFSNVGIRAKGNTSLSQIASDPDTDRYSFKIEFDKYEDGKTCCGLDKLALNNIMSDTTYMKDYLSYKLMNYMGVAAPLTSYMDVSINGEKWGLYLGVECIEESFLYRNYGNDTGELYKPDSMDMGDKMGGEGMNEDMKKEFEEKFQNGEMLQMPNIGNMSKRASKNLQGANDNTTQTIEIIEDANNTGQMSMPEMNDETMKQFSDKGGFGGQGGGVDLVYIDDEIDSYSAIFDSAKTDVTDVDKKRLIESIKKLNNGEDLENAVDIKQVLKYFAVHNFLLNFDSYTGSMKHNYYLYEKDGQLTMIPWDYNLAFGSFGGMDKDNQSGTTSMVNYPIDTPVSGTEMEDRPILNELLQVNEYKEMYHEYLSQLVTKYFDSGSFEKEITKTYNLIKDYVKNDQIAFYTYDEFEKGYETLKQFCILRAKSIEKQLNGEIPTTTEGQKKDSTNFIDASNINIKDMGSQGGGNITKNNQDVPSNVINKNIEETEYLENISESKDITQNSNDENSLGQKRNINKTKLPTNNIKKENSSDTKEIMTIVIISAVVLAIAIVFSIMYKRRRS